MKNLFYFAAVAMVCAGFASCSKGDDSKPESKKDYLYSSIKYEYTYSGAIYDLVNIEVVAKKNGVATDSANIDRSNGKITIAFDQLEPNTKTSIEVVYTRNSKDVDAAKSYERRAVLNKYATRHFSDGSTESGGNIENIISSTSISSNEIAEYFDLVINKKSTYSAELDTNGNLKR